MLEEGKKYSFEWTNVGRQYFAAIIANLIMLAHGTINGWVSPVSPLLLSDDTPLRSGPLTSVELSWIGSMISIGGIFGSLIFGYLTSILGCKRAMIYLTFPSMLFWFLIYFGDTYYYIVIARFLAGLAAGGIQTTVVLFISEIANDNIRGRLGSFLCLSNNIGVLLSYVVGGIVDYQSIPCILVFIQIIYAVVFFCLPNTPQFHLQRQDYQEAEKSLKYYKGFEGDSIAENIAINREFDRLKAIATQNGDDKEIQTEDFRERGAISGIMICILLAIATQVTGALAIISYAHIIIQRSGAMIEPFLPSIIMAVLQIVGSLCTAQLVETLGRKILMIISLTGSGFGLLTLALYLYLNENGFDLSAFSWVPVTSLSFIVFIASAGIISLANVCSAEHLPSKVRTTGLAIFTIAMNISAFLCTKYFAVLMDVIELHGCLLLFAALSISASICVVLFVKETKGQSMDDLKKDISVSNEQFSSAHLFIHKKESSGL